MACDANQCHSIKYLRDALKNDMKMFLWFAKQMEVFYSVLSDDVHSKSPLDIRQMKRKNIQNTSSFSTEIICTTPSNILFYLETEFEFTLKKKKRIRGNFSFSGSYIFCFFHTFCVVMNTYTRTVYMLRLKT